MASIKGIQIKGLKTFISREGCGFNANLYLNGKKIAFCMDSGNGGMIDIDWVSKEAREMAVLIITKYYEENPKYISCDGIECDFIEELIELSEIEKTFKKGIKQGYPVTINISYNKRTATLEEYDFSKKDKIIQYSQWSDKHEEVMKAKYAPVEFKVYKSLEDFNIK